MKAKLALVSLLAFFVLVSAAQAFQWHMRYGQAKHASREFIEQVCHEDPKCTGYAVPKCARASESRFDCLVGTFYAELPGPGEETECHMVLHWGVDHAGYMALKRHGPLHCSLVS